jgi:hypothetical protein
MSFSRTSYYLYKRPHGIYSIGFYRVDGHAGIPAAVGPREMPSVPWFISRKASNGYEMACRCHGSSRISFDSQGLAMIISCP